jgi:hypothetical protein
MPIPLDDEAIGHVDPEELGGLDVCLRHPDAGLRVGSPEGWLCMSISTSLCN